MACTLLIGQRVVLVTEGAPPEAEFALFDPGDIELAATEPGVVREVGYRTTAAEALRRLELGGLVLGVTLEATGALLPVLAAKYARGPVIRRVVPLFGPCELFESGAFDAETRRYDGTWLDLDALSMDLEFARASVLLQAIHLRALLQEIPEDTPVSLDTREHAVLRRAGERSFKRMSLEHIESIPAAIRALAEKKRNVPPDIREEGPTRGDLLHALQARVDMCSDPQAHERFVAIEAALSVRTRPPRGPLCEPEVWAVEEQLSEGNVEEVFEHIDALEKRRGRNPATAYLRARASLLTGREAPTAVAEKASALAMSMNTFPELELLAAEAWTAAGHAKRAAPFARDLIDTPGADDALRARAVQLLAMARSAGISSIPPALSPPRSSALSRPPAAPPPDPDQNRSYPSARAPARSAPSARPVNARQLTPPPRPSVPARPRDSDETFIDLPPRTDAPNLTPSRPWTGPPFQVQVTEHEDLIVAAPRQARLSARPASPQPVAQERIPSAARTGFRTGHTPSPMVRVSSPPLDGPSPHHRDATDGAEDGRRNEPRRSLMPQPMRSSDRMRGASQPPFRADTPESHLHIPQAAPVPASDTGNLAVDLALPPGLHGQPAPADVIPATVIDARVHFTFLGRQLGQEYRDVYGIELRADVSGIEEIQSRLLEKYPDGELKTAEEVLDVRRHGAFLSEILARSLGAFWIDIAPADFGYWAMAIPPATRVWPFGRILRFIAMGHRERDLVSYYLELQARSDTI